MGEDREVFGAAYRHVAIPNERAWIERALDGVGNVERYLGRVDVQQVRAKLRC